MAKLDDFGGLPSHVFTSILATFSTPGGKITDAEKISVLAALAAEEHAGATAADYNVVEVVMMCIQVQNMHTLISTGKAPAGTIGNFVTLLNNLETLWK